jgi:4-alpha-glucanotransferase
MQFERASGILLHPTSFPSVGGIGDLGPAAYEFVDWLASARQHLWQLLPLAPAGYGNSPYSATSAFAGNPLLVSLETLAEQGWLDRGEVQNLDAAETEVNYERVTATKMPLLKKAAEGFLQKASGDVRQKYDKFKWENGWWLEDFVLFDALRHEFKGRSWNEWPHDIKHREPQAIKEWCEKLSSEIDAGRVTQFFFYDQWFALHHYCAKKGVKVIGDVAIFVSFDSADVWSNRDLFRLNQETLDPDVVAGVPPDAFSATGQRWGNPLYRWDVLQQRGYDWWIRRLRWALTTCDIIRLDHFRGFEAYWEIPAQEPTAVNGKWVKGPADDLFNAVRRECGKLPFIAEDLGMITEEVHTLRRRLDVPGMRVLQFGFNNPGAHIYLPHKYEPNTVVYTGTHDNDTTVGWWDSIPEKEQRAVRAYVGDAADGIHWAMIRAAEASVARLCVIPLQDVLGLDAECRMNKPSHPDGNWAWRYKRGALTRELAEKLAAVAEISDRDTGSSDRRQQGRGKMSEHFAA